MEDQRIVRGRHAPEKQEQARQMRREPTPGERYLWQRLRANRLAGLHFRRQQVIEVDGDVHEQQAEYDEFRSRILAGHGMQYSV